MSPEDKPNYDEERYDRQIRLWGQKGQDLLKSSSVLVVGMTIASLEAAKGLILAGCRNITVVSINKNSTTEKKEKNYQNFFMTIADLRELNPSVNVDGIHSFQNYAELEQNLENSENNQFSSIIISDTTFTVDELLSLKNHFNVNNLIILTSIGQIGYMRLILNDSGFYCENTHDEYKKPDMRLENPRPEYLSLVKESAAKLSKYDKKDEPDSIAYEKVLDTIPFPILISIVFEEDGLRTSSDSTKTLNEIKDLLRSRLKRLSENDHENVRQAIDSVHKYVQKSPEAEKSEIISKIDAFLSKSHSSTLLTEYLNTIKDYILKFNYPPICSKLDDMASSTENYITLQNLYQQFAEQDIQQFMKMFREQYGQNYVNEGSVDLERQLRELLKNCQNFDFITCSDFSKEFSPESFPIKNESDLENFKISDWQNIKIWYLFIRKYVYKNCAPPELSSGNPNLLKLPENYQEEFDRYKDTEFHPVAAIIGNLASQECIKLITGQYVPIKGTLIYDGIQGVCSVFEDIFE